MTKKIVHIILLITVLSLQSTHAEIRLPRLVSNGMVLQRDTPLKLWGWATPHENISISFSARGNKVFQTTANDKGEWSCTLPAQKAGGPYTLLLTASNTITLTDIVVGDVWLCSGQSNMEQPMGARLKYKYAGEIATARNDHIRHFLVPDKYDFNQPRTDVESGSWKSVSPETIGEFTAVGYFFAKALYEKNKVPIGLINSALGGSPAEAWISEGSLEKFPAYFSEMQKFKDSKMIADIEEKDRKAVSNWNKELDNADEGLKNNWKDPLFNDENWEQVSLPFFWNNTKAAVTWFRKEITVPASMTGKAAKLELGRITDADSVFINGLFAGTTTYQYPARRYELKSTILKPGKNSIVIRVVSNSGNVGFAPAKRYELTTISDTIVLSGNWRYRTGTVRSPAPSTTVVRFKPGGLYNAMIEPLTNYPIKGVIWYQGETNTNYPGNYQSIMQTLISDWRKKWRREFTFLFVQLPNFMEAKPVPTESNKRWVHFFAASLFSQVNSEPSFFF